MLAVPSEREPSISPFSVYSSWADLGIRLNFSGNLFIFGDKQICTNLVGFNTFISVVAAWYVYVLLDWEALTLSLSILIKYASSAYFFISLQKIEII